MGKIIGSWRHRLEQVSIPHGMALNVTLEADSLSVQS
jgi:hypothetical protein